VSTSSRSSARSTRDLSAELPARLGPAPPGAGAAWAASGAMSLTGRKDGPALCAPAAFASAAARAVREVTALAPAPAREALAEIDGAALLGERAATLGLARAGRETAGGSGRLLDTATGTIALQLPRDSDIELLEALFERARRHTNPWEFAAREASERDRDEIVERGRLLGLAVSASRPPPETAPSWVRVAPLGLPGPRSAQSTPRVLDLASLWAGPLCGHLLGLAGADVIKLESVQRPDGARRGPRAFYDLLNAGKRSVALDFASPGDQGRLAGLIAQADIVIEASRPRALEQLGIDAARCVRERPGTTWISLTGYGRDEPERDWIAFGDDAAVAAGTSAALARQTGDEVFCGDALADPLAGCHAAWAGLASYRAGGGHRLDLSLRDVTAAILVDAAIEPAEAASLSGGPVAAPRAREAPGPAREIGADNAAVLRSLPC